jgi:hypothetical protein
VRAIAPRAHPADAAVLDHNDGGADDPTIHPRTPYESDNDRSIQRI